MAITSTIGVELNLNAAGGTNSPAPTDSYEGTAVVGLNGVGLMTFPVNTTPTPLPYNQNGVSGPGPTTAVYILMITHQGITTDAIINLNMANTANASCIITLSPGGRLYLYNGTIAITGTGYSAWGNWRISCASGTTTAGMALVYT